MNAWLGTTQPIVWMTGSRITAAISSPRRAIVSSSCSTSLKRRTMRFSIASGSMPAEMGSMLAERSGGLITLAAIVVVPAVVAALELDDHAAIREARG